MKMAVLDMISPSMLGWLVAATLPWWIHRWWSHRPEEVPWAAMRLLREAIHERSRRVRLQQWLLLALRTLILLLVALAAAQPVLRQGWLMAGRVGRTHHLLLVDQSYSMASRGYAEDGQPGLSRLARARAVARQIIESASAGDLFTVLGWADVAENPLARQTTEVSVALSAVDQLDLVHAPGRLTVALQAALEAVRQAGQVHSKGTDQQIYVLSDLGHNTWGDAARSVEVNELCQQLAALGELWVCPVGSFSSPRKVDGDKPGGNVAVTRLAVDPPLAMVGVPLAIRASLRAFGSWAGPVQQVELSVDGLPVERRGVALSSGEEEVVRFETRLVEPGQHVVCVACQPGDDLPLDDQRLRVVQTRQQVRLLCLEGRSAGATDLVRALIPRSTIVRAPSDSIGQIPYQVERLPGSRLAEVDLSEYDAVLVCNVAGFQPREARHLLRYARSGGAVLFFLGDQVVPDQYNRLLGHLPQDTTDTQFGLIPMKIEPAVEVRDVHWDPLGYRHPLVAPFQDHPNSGLNSVTVSKYVKLARPRATGQESVRPTLETALAFDTGDPAIVLGPFGSGRVAVVALPGSLAARTRAGTPWSTWSVNPSFLPLVRELIKQVVGRSGHSQFNRLVGEPLVLKGSVWKPGTDAMRPLVVRTPEGTQVQSTDWFGQQPATSYLLLPTTRQRGIYTLLSPNPPAAEMFRYAVNLDAVNPDTGKGESDLATIAQEQLPRSMAQMAKVSNRNDKAEIPLGSTLFATALALLLVELGLAWWIGKD